MSFLFDLFAVLVGNLSRTWQHADAEDAVQIAAQKYMENPKWHVLNRDELTALLYIVARNQLLNERKKLKRFQRCLDMGAIPSRLPKPTRDEEVTAAIRLLPATQRDVIQRVYLGGETNEQAALALNRPLATVKTLRRRGLLRLRTLMNRN